MREVTIKKDNAATIYISHPESSYGIFCYNSLGDLFLNSDWGMYGYAWRSFGDKPFKEFLSNCNAEYIAIKFFINWTQSQPTDGKRRWKNIEPHIINLTKEFIKEIKQSV